MLAFSRAVSGLKVAEQNLYVTSNNISNVNTEGYHRQRLVQYSLQPTPIGNNHIGLGVDASHVKQVRLEYLETNYRKELPKLGECEAEKQVYDSLQALIGSDGSLLCDTMGNLWESFNELSKEYTTSIAGGYLRENAVAFVSEFNSIEEQLVKMQDELDSEIETVVNKINNYAKRISELNSKITSGEAGGVLCCELRDSRESLVAELSKLVDAEVEYYSDTSINIRLGNGHLVVGTKVNSLSVDQTLAKSTFHNPVWESTGEELEVNSGTLKGILDMRGESVVGNYASSTNGSPKEKMDIVVSIDERLPIEDIEAMRNNLSTLVSTLNRQGSNYQFYTSGGEKISGDALKGYVDYLYELKNGGTPAITDEISGLVDAGSSKVFGRIGNYENNIKYREDSNKYMLVFSNEQPNVNYDYVASVLNDIDMRLIAVTSNDVSASWQMLAEKTDGNVYDISGFESEEGAEALGLALSRDFNSRLDGTNNTDGISAFRAGLNKILNGIANEVNAVLRQGVNTYGNRHGDIIRDDKTGQNLECNLDLFLKIDDSLPLQMGNIKINPAFSDVNNMPLSLSGESGDFQIGHKLVELTTDDIFSCGNDYSTADEQYADFILGFAQAANISSVGVATQESVINAALTKQSAVSGVSMDEELSNMMKFQYSYTAASKLINIVDEMLQTVINI